LNEATVSALQSNTISVFWHCNIKTISDVLGSMKQINANEIALAYHHEFRAKGYLVLRS